MGLNILKKRSFFVKLKNKHLQLQKDSVYNELKKIDKDILTALYKLAFLTYEGF